MGKIIGGGFPVGALGGRADVMAVFDPGSKGPRVLAGGTFSGNPVTMTAGLARCRPWIGPHLLASRPWESGYALACATSLRSMASRRRSRGRLPVPFRDGQPPLKNYRDTVEPGVAERANRLFMALLDAGIMINNNGLACLSTPMGESELTGSRVRVDRALSALHQE